MINTRKCELLLFLYKMRFRWSENSVRFENLMGMDFRRAKFCEILSHSVRYVMYERQVFSGCGSFISLICPVDS